jgi:transglutaminase-like putative cysteine protease
MFVTAQTTKFQLLPPTDVERYAMQSKSNRDTVAYLKRNSRIESDDKKFTTLFKEITGGLKGEPDWMKVRAIYDYVRDTIAYDGTYKGEMPKGALTTITDGENKGDCKDMTCVFVAICRAGKIPARVVRVPNHCYGEFYLEDKQANNKTAKTSKIDKTATKKPGKEPEGYWFPCQLAGADEFGGITDVDPILQKGDNFPDIDDAKAHSFYVKEQFVGTGTNGIKPKFTFIHEQSGV